MSKEIQKVTASEVITAEQGQLIDRAKQYCSAHATTEKHERMYLFLIGATLHALKGITPHGQFEQVKLNNFPEKARTTLGRGMTFVDAVQFFAKDKYPTVGYLGQGELFLTGGDLPDAKKDKLADEIEKASKGRGVVELIKDFKKKTNKPKPAAERTAEDLVDAENKAAEELANVYLTAASALMLDEQSIVRLSPAKKLEVLAAGIKLNDLVRKYSRGKQNPRLLSR